MEKSIRPALLAAGLGALILVRCGGPQGEAEPRDTRPDGAVAEQSEGLLDYEWHLEAFGKLGEEEAVLPATSITLTFYPEGKLAGSGGCNRYSTTFRARPSGQIAIRALARTQMDCPGETLDQERAYLDALAEVTDFSVGARKLQLFYGGNEYAMVFGGEPRGDSESRDE